MDKKSVIYALMHPLTNEVKYVGKTVVPKERFATHCRAQGETRNARWIRSIRPLKPIMIVLEELLESESFSAEIWWIAYLKYLGIDLVNHTIGGEGASGAVRSEKTKALMSKSVSSSVRTPEARKRASEAAIKRWSDPETRVLASETQKRIKRTPEARSTISAAVKIAKSSPIARKNASLAATKALTEYYSKPGAREKASIRQRITAQKMRDQKSAKSGQLNLL